VRVADDVDAVGSESAGQFGIERGRERVAGDEQRPQRLLRRRRSVDLRRVEGVGRDRRDPTAGPGRGRGLVEATAAEVFVGGEPAGELVLGVCEWQPALTMSWPMPGSICAAAERIEPPAKRISKTTMIAVAPTASRAL
jgi:hypothetical protein